MQGITGKLSGKMGSAVFRVREGQQVITQYNPIVKNPNSEGQQAQRAKFKLMSQLAAIMASGFGTMSVTTRKAKGKPSQRNAFSQLNFPLVEVSSDNQSTTATIAMDKLKLTSSFRDLPPLNLTSSSGEKMFTVAMSGISSDVTTLRLVVVEYSGTDMTQASIFKIQDVPVSNGSLNMDIAAPVGKFTVLAYGLIPSESVKASINLDNIHTPADEDFISAVELNAMVAAGSMVETKTVGANVEVQS